MQNPVEICKGLFYMNLFYKRPLLLALAMFLILSAMASFATQAIRFYSVIVFAALTSAALLWMAVFLIIKKPHTNKISNLFLCFLFCFLACFSSHRFFDEKLLPLEETTAPVQIVAEVRECTYSASYLSVYTVAVKETNGEKADFQASISIDSATDLEVGNVIATEVQFSAFTTDRYGYNERSNNIANGILIGGTFSTYTLLEAESGSFWLFFEELRNTISYRIDNGKTQSASGLLKAFLLGIRDDLEDTVSLDFRRLGISHILSISGTHFTTLLGMVALLLSIFGINKRVAYALLIPLAIFYMALTGFQPAVCRAGIMAMMSYLGLLTGRLRDSYTALFVSVTGILWVQPYMVYSIGLWLSFSATFAILVLLELMNALEKLSKAAWYTKILYFVFSRLMLTIFISIVTLPITAACFGEISVVSPLGNLLLVPLFELFLYIAPFAVLFANYTPIAHLTDFVHETIMDIVAYFCQADNLLLSVKQDFVFYIAVVGCIATVILLALPLKRRGFVLLPSGISLVSITVGLCIFFNMQYADTDITYFTAGINDGIVITDQNQSLYIDISTGASDPAYKAAYIAEEHYSAEIAGILFTHYHNNHINMFRKLSSSVHVHAVYLPRTDNENAQNHMYAIEDIALHRNIEIIWFEYDTPIPFESCTVTVFKPEYLSRSSHPVVSLEMRSKNQDILYLGSSFNDADRDLSKNAYNAEYILFGQHHPVAKNPYAVLTNAFTIYGDDDRFALSAEKRAGAILRNDGQYEIALK